MSKHADEVKQKRLLKRQDWDTHNKKAEKAAQAYQDFMATDEVATKSKKSSGHKRWLKIAGVVLLLAAIGLAVYWLVLRDTGEDKSAQNEATNQPAERESTLGSSKTEQYESSSFFLSFKYPDTWDTSETDEAIVATSPVVSLNTASGASVRGKVLMTIRHKGSPLTEFDKGNAVATKQSELLQYTNPTQAQRASTYLTFAAFAGATSGLDALYITGDYGYAVGQDILKTEIADIDPVISVTFNQCSDESCTKTTPVSIALTQWGDPSFNGPIKTILQSIAIQ